MIHLRSDYAKFICCKAMKICSSHFACKSGHAAVHKSCGKARRSENQSSILLNATTLAYFCTYSILIMFKVSKLSAVLQCILIPRLAFPHNKSILWRISLHWYVKYIYVDKLYSIFIHFFLLSAGSLISSSTFHSTLTALVMWYERWGEVSRVRIDLQP